MMKKCRVCNQEKPFTDFSYHKTTKDNRTNQCKKCVADKWKVRYEQTKHNAKMPVEDVKLTKTQQEIVERTVERIKQYKEHIVNAPFTVTDAMIIHDCLYFKSDDLDVYAYDRFVLFESKTNGKNSPERMRIKHYFKKLERVV